MAHLTGSGVGRHGLIALVAVAFAGAFPASVLAAPTTLTVTSPSDVSADDPTPSDLTCDTAPASPAMGACTLRAAVDTVNAQTAGSGPYTIGVPAGHILLTNRYDISRAVTITGAGAKTSIIDGQNAANPFFVDAAGLNVTISGLEITGGNSFPRGGAIYNYGNLTLTDDWITANTASDQGGGVYNNGGQLSIVSSTISGNHAGYGAGVNTGQSGGSPQGTLSVVNSTITGNVAATDGGGIRAISDTGTTLLNDTIAANTAGTAGGGLDTESPSGPITVQNTVIAANSVSSGPSDCATAGGAITSLGHNIDQSGTCRLAGPGDRSVDPMLGPLADNGGPTRTMALIFGSPAIDAGDPTACPATDQRGVSRPQGTVCDIGAFEAMLPAPVALTGAASQVSASSAVLGGTVQPNGANTTSYFQYGTGTTYGAMTTAQALSGYGSQPSATAQLSGLQRATKYHFRLVAISAFGTSYGADHQFVTLPNIDHIANLKLSPSTLAAASSGPSAVTAKAGKKRKTGASISYTDSQPATTTFTVQRPVPGRSQGAKCTKPTKRNHKHRRCTRYIALGSFSHADTTGPNKFHFTGRVRGHKLAPGRYRLQAVPRNSAGTGPTASTQFRIKN